MFDSGCIYIPSEALHSKARALLVSSPIKTLIVCHKSQKSFDRSTRRASRSTQHIWSSYVNAEMNDSPISDVYLLSESKKNAASMHERLAKEFESTAACVPVEMPNKMMNVIKFNVDGGEDGLLNVMFVDIDSLSPKENASSVSAMHTLLDLVVGTHTLMHVKSDVISRAITSILSDDNRDSSQCITGEELETFLSGEEQAIIKSHLTGDLIRRLNKKAVASNCPLTNYPARFIECSLDTDERKEICRFYNYDERGCLRSTKAQRNPNLKGCDLDHDHCHRCGLEGHRAFECTKNITSPLDRGDFTTTKSRDVPVPSLLVLGGRCRGRTLNGCEFLPLSPTGNWAALPNLHEHRGSHAACASNGVVFVMGGGGVDGNLDTVEVLDLRTLHPQSLAEGREDFKWNIMSDKLSSARHAFGAVCITKEDTSDADELCVNLYAVGGWMYGTKSCESMEKLSFQLSRICCDLDLHRHVQWEECSPILTPRRLHSVAASVDGSSIFVFGGYIDERKVTTSIESYDIKTDCWSATDELPYPEKSCPLVQAVPDWSPDAKSSFLIFPYSENNKSDTCKPVVLRYSPHSNDKYTPVVVPNIDKADVEHLQMPMTNWHSFSATVSPSLQTVYLVGGLIDSKWTGRGFSLDLQTMKWQELPEMSLPRRRLVALVME